MWWLLCKYTHCLSAKATERLQTLHRTPGLEGTWCGGNGNITIIRGPHMAQNATTEHVKGLYTPARLAGPPPRVAAAAAAASAAAHGRARGKAHACICVWCMLCVCADTMMMRLTLTNRPVTCASPHARHGCNPSSSLLLHGMSECCCSCCGCREAYVRCAEVPQRCTQQT